MNSLEKIFILMLFIILEDSKEIKKQKSNSRGSETDSFIEKEQPELSEESKELISKYQKDPTTENYINLRNSVINNYNSVLVKKENKLEELKEETLGKKDGELVVAEMNEIVQDMYITYWEHITFSMLRFTDKRFFKWKTSEAYKYDYIPVMGAGENVYIKRTPVTNAEYKLFIDDKKYSPPSNWINGNFPNGMDDLPVNYVSYSDSLAFCKWLKDKEGTNSYRLPSESEWELAAGHMPKDADFNAGNINQGRVSVFQYDNITRGAHGAIDFWGNVWEWTSTTTESSFVKVKGGSWKSDRTDCRTENRKEYRDPLNSYDDVGFRSIQILNGIEPESKVEVATLTPPALIAEITGTNNVKLKWSQIDKAIDYQIFEYDKKNNIFKMLQLTNETEIEILNVDDIDNKKYVIQAISYTEFSDNISPEFTVKPKYVQDNPISSNFVKNIKTKINYIYLFYIFYIIFS